MPRKIIAYVNHPPAGFDEALMKKRAQEIVGKKDPPPEWIKEICVLDVEEFVRIAREILAHDLQHVDAALWSDDPYRGDTSVTTKPYDANEKVADLLMVAACLNPEYKQNVLDETANRIMLSYLRNRNPARSIVEILR